MSARPERTMDSETGKLQQHLTLLKREYVKLQGHCAELERKLALVSAHDASADTFASRIIASVAALLKQEQYSDLKILLSNAEMVPAHKFVLKARSSKWGVENLDSATSLDWSGDDAAVMNFLLSWVYTGEANLDSIKDPFCLELMKVAFRLDLLELAKRCEQRLLLTVGVTNCVRLYTTAEEIGAKILQEHCSQLISTHWDEFTSEDFAHMTAPLLYTMLKSKTRFPLHSAIRLSREDVVFLFLVEHSNELARLLNEPDKKGDLPLLLALNSKQKTLASSLVEHGASVDARDPRGLTLLLNAIEREDKYSALFLLEQGASPSATTPDLGDTGLHMIANQSSTSNPFQDEEEEDSHHSKDIIKVAQKLLSCGLNPNMQNNKGYSALHLSVLNDNTALFNMLLDFPGLALDVPTQEGHTALRYALLRNSLGEDGLASRLLAKKANPNPMYPATGDTLLHLLARERKEDAAVFLCSKGGDALRTNKRGETALHVACENDLAELAKTLLYSGALPNLQTLPSADDPSDHRQTPLHLAIKNGCDAVVDIILAHKNDVKESSKTADLNLKNSSGLTPLALAIRTGMKHKVADLINAGADVNVTNSEGLTLLHSAIEQGDSDAAVFLLEHGANMSCRTPDRRTPLQLSITNSLPVVVEALCKRGVDMSIIDNQGRCALWAALEDGQEDVASILVRFGVDTDCWGPGPEGCLQTLLHKSIDENLTNIACFLIRSGCEMNAPRRPGPNGEGGDEARDGQFPLHMACTWGQEQVVQTLIEHKAHVNAKDADGRTPLHLAVSNQNAKITSLLLCHPELDLSVRDKSGLTPFAAALTCRNNKAAQAILDRLPSAAEQYDNKGLNFLHVAIQRNDLESVLFLLSINVDPNSKVRDSTMSTPLHLACASVPNPTATGTTEDTALLVRNLLLAGARPNERNSSRQTPLHIAAVSGHSAAASALLQNNADPDATDVDNNNPLHLAVKASNLPVVRALLTESTLDAEAKNLRGQNPLHMLAIYGKDQIASAICELFLECMPQYPLDEPDLEGNTALLWAYVKGKANLCRTLVKSGCCVGTMNKEGITIFNYQTPTKQLLSKLLDLLGKEPPWAEGDMCLECGSKFGITMRKHHCRHCGRLLCSKCSSCDVPILKFGLNKPVRVCTTCFQVLQSGVTT
ncbi:rabankyrin-5 [Neocloeon triangulifer]|uniref:rabankyrin-5 n=1 Tax=Neocloeon triangulifer TaxID=2078957 RepID=UPI00286EC8D2|nr:rabankyrin-5 [Neocloeon triangulifer]